VNKVLRYTIDAIDKSKSVLTRAAARIKSFAINVFSNLINIEAGWRMLSGAAQKAMSVLTAAFKMETIEKQFAILMRSVDGARIRMDELKNFSASTPFQIDGIAKASRQLHVFSEGVLGGTSSLKLVGDAAAAVGVSIEELSFWVGRAYSMIKGGQPFGEAAMRLQEMGVMTPQARKEMERLQESGANASEVWGVLAKRMGEFDGGMKDLSETGDGLVSTIEDNWTLAVAEFGKSFMDLAKTELAYLNTWLEKLSEDGSIKKWADASLKAVKPLVEMMMNLTDVESRGQSLKASWDYLKSVWNYGADIIKSASDYFAYKLQAAMYGFTGAKSAARDANQAANITWTEGIDLAGKKLALAGKDFTQAIAEAADRRHKRGAGDGGGSPAKLKGIYGQAVPDDGGDIVIGNVPQAVIDDLDKGINDAMLDRAKKTAEALKKGAAAIGAKWSNGPAAMAAWKDEGEKAKIDEQEKAKFEDALEKAQDRERRLGERSLKKSDKELIAFWKKQAEELKKADDMRKAAMKLADADRLDRKELIKLQKESNALLANNLQMDGGGNAGGPE
jgi:hypothetical protein